MGAFTSRRNAGIEEVDIAATNAYRYPPKSGCYFGSYFIMGGERFDTTQPESYLFGENQDLNFLGSRPIPFPYPAPQSNEPTKTLKSLVNIRKDSLRFIRIQEDNATSGENKPEGDSGDSNKQATYNIEFTFDTDVRVAITIYYFATEEISGGQAIYHPRDTSMNSETFHYKRGANQTFSQTTHIIDPSKFSEEEWQYNPDKEVIPVVIQCVVEDEADHCGHSHMLFGTMELSESGYVLKPLKQKQMVDGLCYLLQEIYGIENKDGDRTKDDELDDNGSECVICMSDLRDTLILPCRHLCLCNTCADSLRYQANNCPICRSPFRALLQIRAMRRKLPLAAPPPAPSEGEESAISQEGVPPGFEAVSLIEALNGPCVVNQTPQNTLRPTDTRPTSVVTSSLPTSPEESPVLNKRRTKRQSSVRSHRSAAAAALVEEAEEAKEDGTELTDKTGDNDSSAGRKTPEVVMSGEVPDPIKESKSPPKNVPVIPKMRHSKKMDKNNMHNEDEGKWSDQRADSLEIVDELKKDDGKKVDGAIGGIADVQDEEMLDGEQAETQLTAHTGIYSSSGLLESKPLCESLEGLTVPGTCSADESSYSSTNSGQTLLDSVPSLRDGKPVV